jgi:hypothetical protein
MQRWLMAAVLGLCLVGLATAQDVVTYYDRVTKKDRAEVRGKIVEESPAGVKIKLPGKSGEIKLIPAGDIRHLTFTKMKDLPDADYRKPFNKEDKARGLKGKKRIATLEEALKDYAKLEADLRNETTIARRYVQYRAAAARALLAQEDKSKVDEAIKALTDFKEVGATSWTIVPALKTLARLQEETGKTDDARKTYEALADLPDVPKALKEESEILVGRLLLRGGQFAAARKRLEKLAGSMSEGDPQKPFVDVYLVESKIGQDQLDGVDKALEKVIKSSSDARLRGTAYNLLGDYYRKKGQKDNAFWAYLRVDALYNEGPEAQAKALWYLSSLFDEVKKDPVRGKDCLRRLRDKRFEGTAFQKLAPKEAPAESDAPVRKAPKR